MKNLLIKCWFWGGQVRANQMGILKVKCLMRIPWVSVPNGSGSPVLAVL